MYRRWPLAVLAAALALIAAPPAFGGAGSDPPAAAGWHGREIRDPLPKRVSDAVARFPRGWSAGGVALGSGYASSNGSRRVREVQRRLLRRGYRPGPVDGRFGARTRAAVIWFQTKHGLSRTGRVDARGVATLRQTPAAGRAPATGAAPSPPSAAEEARAFARTSPSAPLERADRTWLVLLAVMLMLGLAAILRWVRAELRARPVRPAHVRDGEPRAQLTAVTPPPAHAPVDVVGYVAVARGKDRDRELDTGAQSVGSWCERRGWQLTRLVHDVEPASGRITDRPGLAYALDQIAAGRVAGLVLAHLGDLTHSATELAQLLQWLNQAEAFVIALDYDLDTSTAAGELAAGALIQIGGWERSRIADRTRPGLTAMQTGGANNHASVRDDPELSGRISAMRAQGMSLQAISDTLNAESVPTLRGGTHWRPSSVQAATGYKRPSAKPAGGLELPPLARTNGNNTQERWDN
ncbi:peptidoglycan-binding protein [Solirubrobacter ginsenosidimutans]|uniref:Peptidoglycan-binding protein n=1 Tax=Solirubrobacter ginsenosidimutans TaxID=490573 RepID=A0A9X3MQ36_9ACTN|nr:peptidoglycan-binding protein [Solirubrobacter ginsenosidimutans]MDA0159170.1 peptidoglycan-binding protein [Solirubrobacter ginsenosidimutans]